MVGLLVIELWIETSQSLKDKRRVLNRITDRIKTRFNVSIAEIGHQELWQRATLGVAAVSNETAQINKILDSVLKYIESLGEAEVVKVSVNIY